MHLELIIHLANAAHTSNRIQHIIELFTQRDATQCHAAIISHDSNRFRMLYIVAELGANACGELMISRLSFVRHRTSLGGNTAGAVCCIFGPAAKIPPALSRDFYRLVTHQCATSPAASRIKEECHCSTQSEPGQQADLFSPVHLHRCLPC